MSNRLDPVQAVRGLAPNCLQKLSADDTSRQSVKAIFFALNCKYFLICKFKHICLVLIETVLLSTQNMFLEEK